MLRNELKDLKLPNMRSVGFQLSPWGVFKAVSTPASSLGPDLLLGAAQMAAFTHIFFYFNKLVVT